jgi:hypothetical protein
VNICVIGSPRPSDERQCRIDSGQEARGRISLENIFMNGRIFVVGASLSGIDALCELVSKLPAGFGERDRERSRSSKTDEEPCDARESAANSGDGASGGLHRDLLLALLRSGGLRQRDSENSVLEISGDLVGVDAIGQA